LKDKFPIWANRISAANQRYKQWESLFNCRQLEDYYEGRQWKYLGVATNKINNYRPYVLNVIYSTIQIKLANLLLRKPTFLVDPQPGHADWNPDFAYDNALLKEAALNTNFNNPNLKFAKRIKRVAMNSFFRFGIGESGYAADWRNPNKTPALVTTDENPEIQGKGTVEEDEEVPFNEQAYFKHIPARRFRVSTDDDPELNNCAWCGYYRWMRKSTLLNTKGIKIPAEFQSSFYSIDYKPTLRNLDRLTDDEKKDYVNAASTGQLCKVWYVFDNVRKIPVLLLEEANFETIWEGEKYDSLPFEDIVWDEGSTGDYGFYPVPPVFHWLSPQDEINQVREQLRHYRKHWTRKFWTSLTDQDEIEKLGTNIDGIVVNIPAGRTGDQVIGVIENPNMGAPITAAFEVSQNDTNIITGTSANQQAQADRTTATESKIISARAQIRESADQMDFNDFVCRVGRKTLITMRDNFTEGMWAQVTKDPGDFLGELEAFKPNWQYISAQDIGEGGYDFEITLNVTDMTPAAMIEQETAYLKFVSIMGQNPQIALSPLLIRETAFRVGYKNLRVIREFQKMALLAMLGQAQGMTAGGQGNPKGNGPNQSMSKNAGPKPQQEIDSQLQNQVQ